MCCCKATNSLVGCSILIGSSQRLKHYGPPASSRSYCWRACKPDFYQIHQTIQPPSINPDRISDGSKDRPHISPSTGYYRSPENKIKSNHHIQFNKNNNLQNKIVEQTYHEVLRMVVNELLCPLLAVLTPHVRLHE